MNTVEEIEQAAEQLAPSDFDRLASWVSARYHDLWKRQMERDATAGRLDFLFNEAAAERQAGSSTTGLPTRNDFQSHAPVLETLPGVARTRPTAGGEKLPALARQSPYPSLDFKKLAGQGERFSIRVGDHYRALGHKISGGCEWVWIGTHEDYNKLIG